MRHETCLTCRLSPDTDANVQAFIVVSESIGAQMHHHHIMNCDGCGKWWFDDVILGGLGIPVAARRDTTMCACLEGFPQYTPAAALVPVVESKCSCTAADVEKHKLPIRLGKRPRP